MQQKSSFKVGSPYMYKFNNNIESPTKLIENNF